MKKRNKGTLGEAKGAAALDALRRKMTPAVAAAASKPVPASAVDFAVAMAQRARQTPPPTAEASKASAKRKPENNKQIIKLPRAQAEAVLKRLAEQAHVPNGDAAVAAPVGSDFGAADYKRVMGLRSKLDRFGADHRAPDAVGEATLRDVTRRLALGAGIVETILDPDNGYFVGHDFGTSTTKVVLRSPYNRSRPAFALPVPADWSSGGQPHLWPTMIFFQSETGRFSLLPTTDSKCLSGFKSALIENCGHRICAASGVTMAEAATAFLALHLAYTLGALVERDPEALLAGVNVGVPVAALADGHARQVFMNIFSAAHRLVTRAENLTLDDLRQTGDAEDIGAIPFELHAELSGAIAGYCAGPRPFLGPHMIIDCGSATLDMASFGLGREPWPIGIHAASVERLGADACAVYVGAGATIESCRRAARYQEYAVFRDTLRRSSSFRQDEQHRFLYQVILTGGGIDSDVHKPLLDSIQTAFHRSFHRPLLDRDLQCEAGTQPGRLILADGLARDPIELREVAMPRDRPVAPDYAGPEMITKDQM